MPRSPRPTALLPRRTSKLLRIDAFQSFTPEHPPEHLGTILARNRFDGSIAIEQDADDPRELLLLTREHEFVRAAIPCVDLDDPKLPLLLDELAQFPKFRGVFCRLGETIPGGLSELARRGLTLDLVVRAGQLRLAGDIAARHPDLRFAIAHLGAPDIAAGNSGDWAIDIAAPAHFPQVYCKASDLIHLAPAPWKGVDLRPCVQHVLEAFSPSRVMFGSGWPSGLPDHIWKETLAAFTQAIGAQTMEVREELLGGVARRFYGGAG
jgi:L-fuconolactonase